jgi:hypothetical protein
MQETEIRLKKVPRSVVFPTYTQSSNYWFVVRSDHENQLIFRGAELGERSRDFYNKQLVISHSLSSSCEIPTTLSGVDYFQPRRPTDTPIRRIFAGWTAASTTTSPSSSSSSSSSFCPPRDELPTTFSNVTFAQL